MLKKRIIYVLIIIILLITCLCIIINKKQDSNNTLNEQENIEKIEEVKEETGATGNSDIYEVQEDKTTNTEIVTVKANIKYKVAFAGMIKQSKPAFGEIDKIFEENYPKKNGIWIENNSRDKILQILNRNLNNEYEINKNGYLDIKKEDNLTDIDKELKKMIGAKKKYIITISEVYYGVDRVSGEILDNFYEDMDPYQATKIVDYGDDIIIFVTTNKEQKLTDKEILQELISYM